jgi:asparagine synthetase B (glutamine-hydrolysing)
VPFLDRNFLDVAMAIDPAEKMIDKSKGEPLMFWVKHQSNMGQNMSQNSCRGAGKGEGRILLACLSVLTDLTDV